MHQAYANRRSGWPNNLLTLKGLPNARTQYPQPPTRSLTPRPGPQPSLEKDQDVLDKLKRDQEAMRTLAR
jgi:hypothetical protein